MIWLLCLLLAIAGSNAKVKTFQFQRVLTCSIQTATSCIDWIENTVLNAQYTEDSSCFPEDTFVLTASGPKQISRLKVGEEVWGYDQEKEMDRFSTVLGWLHRDEWAESIFQRITTN